MLLVSKTQRCGRDGYTVTTITGDSTDVVNHDESEFHVNYTIHPTKCAHDIQHDTKLALSLTYWSKYVLLNITWISLSYSFK